MAPGDEDFPGEPDPSLSLAELAAEANRRKGRGLKQAKPVEHDTRCDNQDAAVRTAVQKADDLAKDLHREEIRVERLFTEVENLMARIPETLAADIATLTGKVTTAIRDLDDLKKMIRSDFVTRAELDPIKRLVYGVVALILAAVVGGLLGLVILK